MQTKEFSTEIGGRTLTATFSDLAEQANGSVMLRYGQTVVLATVVMSNEPTNMPYFNLTVDYVEKFYASGQILGSRFTRREGRPSDEAVLSGRVIDRTIRPLFNQRMDYGVQVITTVLSADENDPGIVAINAASLALAVSDIPWNGPVGAIRIGKSNGDTIINPPQHREHSEHPEHAYDVVVCGKDGKINMIEAVAHQVAEDELETVFVQASKEIAALEAFQKKIVAEIGKEKRSVTIEEVTDEAVALFDREIAPKLEEHVFSVTSKAGMNELSSAWMKLVKEQLPDKGSYRTEEDYFNHRVDMLVHQAAVDSGRRVDGRAMDEVRPLYAQAGRLSEVVHGSGVFYRGGTHVLSVLTLGGPEDAHLIDGMELKTEKRFMHHYNFPPYSVGEMGRATFVNRREIGHGALAEKALSVVIPSKETFPYTIRLVSESMASNGSTSQASICAATLALMDGGVPITAPVAGIAMGLMYKDEQTYKILTDIQGPEDHHGDMDFKVAGTEGGVTAIQLDVKVDGISIPILKEALLAAREARIKILKVMTDVLPAPRSDISSHAPKILHMRVPVNKIGLVIGPGGKTVNKIKDETGAEIHIEDDGSVFVTGKNGAAEKALALVEDVVREFTVGEVVTGEVVSVVDFGAFVKLNPHNEGLVHVSEIAPFRVDKVETYLSVGQKVPVKVLKNENGKIKLSIKEANRDLFTPAKS